MTAHGIGYPQRAALITGASRGIGLAVAARLAALGYELTLSGRHREALEEVARDLAAVAAAPEAPGRTQLVVADMASGDDVHALARQAAEFGLLDLLVLSACFGSSGPLGSYALGRFDRQVEVNLRGPFTLIQECLPLLRQAAARDPERGARIVAIASTTGVTYEPGLAAYGATKAALISLCQSVNAEESRHGVSATAISPGWVDTDMSAWVQDRIAPRDMIRPADIAALVAALAALSPQTVVPHMVVARPGALRGLGA